MRWPHNRRASPVFSWPPCRVCDRTAYGAAALFGLLAWHRGRQAWRVLRYQRHLRALPRYRMRAAQIPWSPSRLFLGRGFAWGQKHTQRLRDTLRPDQGMAHSRAMLADELGYLSGDLRATLLLSDTGSGPADCAICGTQKTNPYPLFNLNKGMERNGIGRTTKTVEWTRILNQEG